MSIESKIHLNKFLPRSYQLPLVTAFENKGFKKLLVVWPRRAGKDIVAWNLMIREAVRKVGVYFYCLPTFKQARLVIWDSITNDGQRFIDFLPSGLIAKTNSQEMKITLVNGSILQLIGSDTYDTSLVGTNARMIVFSEFALADPRAYQFSRPLLNANDGKVILVSCVSPETFVITKNGFKRIENISSSREIYSPLNKAIYGLGGFHKAEQFYYGGKQKTLKIILQSGYELECTPIHPIWDGSKWVQAQDYKIGDLLPIQYGQNVWPKKFNIYDYFNCQIRNGSKGFPFDINSDDFFYLLGLIHADGNYNKNIVCITNKKDDEIKEFLISGGFKTRKDGIHHERSGRRLCSLLEFLDFKHGAKNKLFPELLFKSTRKQMVAFLQGLFDGDGCSSSHPSKRGNIKFTSTCKEFINDLQVVLLNFGIVSSTKKEEKLPTKKVNAFSTIYNLEITGYFAHIFYRDIGFRLKRKQDNYKYVPLSVRNESGNIYPVDSKQFKDYKGLKGNIANLNRITRRTISLLNKKKPHPYFKSVLKEKLFYSPIKSIIDSENEVFDFVIPETKSFFSNGFISHNTPRGKNWFYDLYQIAQRSPDWFCYKLTLEDTDHISVQEIENEIASVEISRELANQEYWTSFDKGQEGAVYGKYIDKMRLDGRITLVPWESNFPVHTAWDLGIRDATSIIMFQVIGTSIRIIDCYENTSVGLEHYIKRLMQMDYQWGRHIAPHDIAVRELGTGMSRLEKARELGISFKVAKKLSLEDGIEAVRSTLPKIYIDENKCSSLIKALENYHYEFDSKRNVYSPKPIHDSYSHFADSVRYLCISLAFVRRGTTPEELDKRYRDAVYGGNSNIPSTFQNPRY